MVFGFWFLKESDFCWFLKATCGSQYSGVDEMVRERTGHFSHGQQKLNGAGGKKRSHRVKLQGCLCKHDHHPEAARSHGISPVDQLPGLPSDLLLKV